MHGSDGRILVTHVGSIPRPPVLRDLLVRQDRGEPVDQRDLDRLAEQAVRHVVEQQLEAGVDVGNDGEQPRAGFSTYVARRMEGFGGESRRPLARDIAEHPDYRAMLDFRRRNSARVANAPQAVAEVRYTDLAEAERECDLFTRCADGAPRQFTERFMTAVSPGTAATILLNAHYDSHEQYIDGARPRAPEGVRADPRARLRAPARLPRPRDGARALLPGRLARPLPPDGRAPRGRHQPGHRGDPRFSHPAARLLGNYDGPHTHDVPMEAILPLLYRAKVGALSLPLANPRHQHEYTVLKHQPPPAGMLLLPGVIDTTTNYVEHPQVVADRICQAVDAVGDRERVIASTDCGFGTFAGSEMVAESVVWAKLRTLARGAELASARLWG